MAGLVPFNRSNDLSGYNGFYNMLDDFFAGGWPFARNMADMFKLDVREDENEYHIEADLPGVKKDEIELSLDEGRLLIGVRREEQTENKRDNYIHRERRYNSMQRSVYLADADSQSIKAKLNNGVLEITIIKLPKQNRTRRIEID